MNEQHRTSEQEEPANGWDQPVRAVIIADNDDDTEAHGGKIFVRSVSHLKDVADREGRLVT